jgi:hypothetical protein
MDDWHSEYAELLGKELVELHGDVIDQIIPQSSIFLSAYIFWKHVTCSDSTSASEDLIEALESDNHIIIKSLGEMISFAKNHRDVASKSWPTLLKSQTFFDNLTKWSKEMD